MIVENRELNGQVGVFTDRRQALIKNVAISARPRRLGF